LANHAEQLAPKGCMTRETFSQTGKKIYVVVQIQAWTWVGVSRLRLKPTAPSAIVLFSQVTDMSDARYKFTFISFFQPKQAYCAFA
jgi:hypothetical protein